MLMRPSTVCDFVCRDQKSRWVTFVTSSGKVSSWVYPFISWTSELENIVAFKSVALLLLIIYKMRFLAYKQFNMQIQLSSLDNRQSKLLKTKEIYCWQLNPFVVLLCSKTLRMDCPLVCPKGMIVMHAFLNVLFKAPQSVKPVTASFQW